MGNARFFEAACSIEFEKMKPHRNEMEGSFRILQDPGKYTKIPEPKPPKFRDFYPTGYGHWVTFHKVNLISSSLNLVPGNEYLAFF